jgi:SAM-dependent methyltransferase
VLNLWTAFVRRLLGRGAANRPLLYRRAFVRGFVPERVAIRLLPYRKCQAHDSDHRLEKWSFLDGISEFAHHSIIAGYYARLRQHGSVLDLGCAAGLLQRTLAPYNYSRYVGIDISPAAIDRALLALQSCRPCPETVFQVGDMEAPITWNDSPFDVIILNESLYYAEKPVEVLSRLREEALAPSGIFIISMYRSLNTERLWRLLARHGWRPTDATTVSNKAGTMWTVAVFAFRA